MHFINKLILLLYFLKVSTASKRTKSVESHGSALPPPKRSKKSKDYQIWEMLEVRKQIRDQHGELVRVI